MKSRGEKAKAFEKWAEEVDTSDLQSADTKQLRIIADLAADRHRIDGELEAAVQAARDGGRSWAEIGAMLGVTKQAAQQRFRGSTRNPAR